MYTHRDEVAPGADGCQLIPWRRREREGKGRESLPLKTHFHTIMTDGPMPLGRLVKPQPPPPTSQSVLL